MFDNLRKLLGRSVEAGAMQRPQGVAGGMGAAGAMRGAMGAARGAMPGAIQAEDGSFVGRDFYNGKQQTPSQRDYPGRTNYGVPEDNMIDTPQGYITPQQYDMQQAFRQPGNSLDALRKLLRF